MNDDTNWLKKNPTGNAFRRSLRSSRFYGQNMDGSIVTQRDGSKDQVLPVSYVPRRSNIPMATIKEMNFKIPTLMKAKTGLKKPVTRISKPLKNQDYTLRQSTLKSERNQSGLMVKIQNGNAKNSKRAPSASSSLKLNKMECKPNDSEKPKEPGIKSFDDTSILSQSKIVNQSTPKEATALRSILKQNQVQSGDTRKGVNGEKPKAAKRVNFNRSDEDDDARQKEKEKEKERYLLKVPQSFPTPLRAAAERSEHECDEPSSLFDSFSVADDSRRGNRSREDSLSENQLGLEGLMEMEKENQSSPDSSHIFKVWRAYREGVNNIRTQMHSLDEEWRNDLKSEMASGVGAKFARYVQEKKRLYEQLQNLEEEIGERFSDASDAAGVKKLFLNYFDRKESFLREQAELEDNFEKTLRSFVTKRMEERREARGEDGSGTPAKSKRYNKSPKRRKSGCGSGAQKRGASRRNACAAATNESGDTPARQRELSTKIERQIKTLFED